MLVKRTSFRNVCPTDCPPLLCNSSIQLQHLCTLNSEYHSQQIEQSMFLSRVSRLDGISQANRVWRNWGDFVILVVGSKEYSKSDANQGGGYPTNSLEWLTKLGFYMQLKGKTRPGRNSSPALLPGTAFEPPKTRYSILLIPPGTLLIQGRPYNAITKFNTGTC